MKTTEELTLLMHRFSKVKDALKLHEKAQIFLCYCKI